jgi:xanthine dehydrogenase accessory factor
MWEDIVEKISETLHAGKRGALATVVRSIGSTPRHEGSKMLVTEDGDVIGTIGGGVTEARVSEAAKEVIASGSAQYIVVHLNERDNPDGLICGGEMHLFIEPVMENVLYIFGGGHVGLALAGLCTLAGVPYVICGGEEEAIDEKRFPEARMRHRGELERVLAELDVPPSAGVVIATRSAEEDEKVLAWALRRRLAYLAMLGSATKRKKLLSRLRRAGLPAEDSPPLHCPAGIEIGAETPGEIAVSIMAEFISVLRKR